MSFSYEDMVREIERELRMRARVYPGRIANGRLTEQTAIRQMNLMEAIRGVLAELAKTERLL